MSDAFDSYGNMHFDQRVLIMVLLQKLSPGLPVELTEADFNACRNAFPNGPALSAVRYKLAGTDTVTLELIDVADALRQAESNGLGRRP